MTDSTDSMNRAWLDRYEHAVAGVLPAYFDVVAERAEGSWIWDVDGKRYLDFGSGIAVTVTGHCHPRVVAAIQEQAASLVHTSVVFRHRPYIELAERLGGQAPFLDRPRVMFCNSGAEAVDGSIKLARRVTGKPGIIGFRRGFHGRTIGGTSLTTAKSKYRNGYEPLLPSVYTAPYCIPFDHGNDEAAACAAALDELDQLLASSAPPENMAAMIVEPVLGEGGYVPPPAAWLRGLRERCDAGGMLLIFDEVQTGAGHTGRPFAAETYGVTPDVVLFAKGVASGLPLGGIMAGASVMDRWPLGSHGTTFGGNPVACAAALATLDVLDDDGLYERATELGERAMARLRDVAADTDVVLDVRGIGLMIGVQLRDADVLHAVQRRCIDDGLIVLSCGPNDDVLRLIPALTISDDELELGLDILSKALLDA
jgi:4-aminobutyrate aminotransferase